MCAMEDNRFGGVLAPLIFKLWTT